MPLTGTPFTEVVQPVAIVASNGNDLTYTDSGIGALSITIPTPPQSVTIKSLHVSFAVEPPDGVIWQILQGATVLLEGAIAEQSQLIDLNFSATTGLTVTLSNAGVQSFLNVITEAI
jgi:hypothetical protein